MSCYRRTSETATCFCSVLAAAATLVLLGIAGPRSTAREQQLAPGPVPAVDSAERGAPTLFGPALPCSAGAVAAVACSVVAC